MLAANPATGDGPVRSPGRVVRSLASTARRVRQGRGPEFVITSVTRGAAPGCGGRASPR